MVSTWAAIAPLLKERVPPGDQKPLAGRLGVSASRLNRYLLGKTTPDPMLALRLAAAIGVDLSSAAGIPGTSQAVVARPARSARELDGAGVPLVAIDVAAGEGALTAIEDLDDERVYFFHRAWMRERFGWNERQLDRFACVKLGSDAVAASMEPTLRPRSLLLVDRKPTIERLKAKAREIYLVRPPDEKETVKRVTLAGETMILESDNPSPRYAPRSFSTKGEAFREIVRGRIVWWATEA